MSKKIMQSLADKLHRTLATEAKLRGVTKQKLLNWIIEDWLRANFEASSH